VSVLAAPPTAAVTAPVVLALPGDPDQRTGGYIYDRRMVAELEAMGIEASILSLPMLFPEPEESDLRTAEARLAAVPRDHVLIVDGLALGVMPDVAARLSTSRDIVALVHHPLAEETGLDAETVAGLRESERAALSSCARVIVTSPATARRVARDYGVPADAITVVEPGTAPAPLSPAWDGSGPLRIVCVATLTPRKGQVDLIAGLARLPAERDWRLDLYGATDRDPPYAARVRQAIAAAGLEDRIAIHGEVSPEGLSRAYGAAHLFALPSHLEGYGMALTEALAHGLPILSTTGGAIPDTVPPQAGILVAPGDDAAMADALERILTDRTTYARLRGHAQAVRAALPDWPDQARRLAGTLFR
jgi:glycosyltransferase involved in cell wall biosynthesis